jgi:hypothetical protein
MQHSRVFKAEMVIELPSASTKRARLQLVRTIMDSDTGNLVHMFKCSCGERTWTE